MPLDCRVVGRRHLWPGTQLLRSLARPARERLDESSSFFVGLGLVGRHPVWKYLIPVDICSLCLQHLAKHPADRRLAIDALAALLALAACAAWAARFDAVCLGNFGVKSKVGQNRVFWGRQAREVRRLPMRHESGAPALSLEGTALRNPPFIALTLVGVDNPFSDPDILDSPAH